MFDFHDKVVLAVGGAGYLCSPACRGLAEHGATLMITDLDGDRAETTAGGLREKYGVEAAGIALDVGDIAAIETVVADTARRFGRIDILINASYRGFHTRRVTELLPEEFDEALHVQVTGAFVLSRTVAAVMPDGGNMLHFSSMYGRVSPEPGIYHGPMIPNPIDYGAGKAAVDQMIRYLAVHYAQRNIRVNGVAPGAFPHAVSQGFNAPEFQEFVGRLAAKAPMKRIGRQEELAGPVVFLVSEEASFVTGQILVVDGGWTIW